jgi:hypothetical protein
VRAVVEATLADHLLHAAVLVEEQARLVDVAGEEGGTHQRHGHHPGGREPDLRVIPVADGLRELFAQAVDGDDSTVHLVLSIRGEGFGRPSDREDIDYPDRGPLGLQYQAIGFIALRSHKRVSWRREMLVWIGMHSRSCSMATTMYC